MKVVTIPKHEKFLFDLLKDLHEEGLILQTTDGQQFALLPLEGWQGFHVGESEEFEKEVNVTAENKELIAFLAERRSREKRTSMADVKEQLGLR